MASLTFHGHSAAELVLGGKHVWIDPFLTGNPKAVVKAAAVAADVIVLTHGHSDHVGDTIDIARRTNAVVVATYELAQHCAAHGVRRIEPGNIGGTIRAGDVAVSFTPAWHSSALDQDGKLVYMGPSTGAVVRGGGKCVYHMGDTGLFGDIRLIAERMGPFDAALVPCGDRFTMGLEDAVLAAQWISARVSVPIHFGTFPIVGDHGAEFARRVSAAGGVGRCLKPGEAMEI